MDQDDLGRLLRSLPAERAPEGFARRVLERIDAPARRPWRGLVFGLLALGALTTALVVWAGGGPDRRGELRAELARLQREARSLEQALARPAGDPQALVYLGEDERADYVLDLGQLEASGGLLPVLLTHRGQGGVL